MNKIESGREKENKKTEQERKVKEYNTDQKGSHERKGERE